MILIFICIMYIMGMVGITHIISEGKIARPIRESALRKGTPFMGSTLYEMLSCNQCAGMWIGMLLSPPLIMTGILATLWHPLNESLAVLGPEAQGTIMSFITAVTVMCAIPSAMFICGGAISLLAVFIRGVMDWFYLNSVPNYEEIPDETGNQTSDNA